MNTVKTFAYAKVNLTLDIVGAENGYHMLDSLAVTIDLADKIVVKKRKDPLVNVFMHGKGSSIAPEENNAVRAGEAFVKKFGTCGADIEVYKNIPLAAGLGGSSADAAGVVKALAKLYEITDGAALGELCDTLGSDTKFLLRGGFARLRGRGEKIDWQGACPEWYFLLLCPKAGVSTAECYREYDRLQKTYAPRTERCLETLKGMGAEEAGKLFGNDLFEAAAQIEPVAAEALAAARSFSPFGASMTGSGSASFAAFPSKELAEWAKSRYRGRFRAYCVRAIDPSGEKTERNPFYLSEDEYR